MLPICQLFISFHSIRMWNAKCTYYIYIYIYTYIYIHICMILVYISLVMSMVEHLSVHLLVF